MKLLPPRIKRRFPATVAATRVHASRRCSGADIIVEEWNVSRFISAVIFMHAVTSHARRSAIDDMFVGHDLLPTSATVNLSSLLLRRRGRETRKRVRMLRLHGRRGVAPLKRDNRHEIYLNRLYLRFF